VVGHIVRAAGEARAAPSAALIDRDDRQDRRVGERIRDASERAVVDGLDHLLGDRDRLMLAIGA
jgi:hypothetical protein